MAALALVALTAGVVVPRHDAVAASPTITTAAGGPGRGPATSLAITALSVAVRGSTLYLLERAPGVPAIGSTLDGQIRTVDLVTGASTVLGGSRDVGGFTGDGGPATGAKFAYPSNITVDSFGNVFVADTANHRVRRIGTDGNVSTVAGNGSTGDAPDGATATAAALDRPVDVELDSAGNLLVADAGQQRVRTVSTGGVLGTFPGTTGIGTMTGIAVGPTGDLYVLTGAGLLQKVTSAGSVTTLAGGGSDEGDDAPALSARLSSGDITVEPNGDVLLSDFERIRRYETLTQRVKTVVSGVGTSDIARSASGELFSPHWPGKVVYRISPTLQVSTVAGNGTEFFGGDGGPGPDGQLRGPQGLDFDPAGNLYFFDRTNSRIRKLSPDGQLSTIAGTGQPATSYNDAPTGVATSSPIAEFLRLGAGPDGSVYLAEPFWNRVRRIHPNGQISVLAGTGSASFTGDGGPATAATLNSPNDVAVDDNEGWVYIADTGNAVLRVVDPDTGFIDTAAGTGETPGPVTSGQPDEGPIPLTAIAPNSIDVSGRGDVYFTDSTNWTRKLDWTCGVVDTVGFGRGDIGVDPAGGVFFAEALENFVGKFSPSGARTRVVGGSGAGLSGDGGPPGSARLRSPWAVAVGPSGQVAITDTGNDRIRVVNDLAATTQPATRPDRCTPGEFTPLPPARILDTRTGLGHAGKITPADGGVLVPVAGRGGVPAAGAGGVVMNVTVTEPDAWSHLTIYPASGDVPLASNLNFVANQTVPNLVTVPLGNGGVRMRNNTGATHVIFDVVGWYADDVTFGSARYHPLSPARVLDTRYDTGGVSGKVPASQPTRVQIAGRGGVPTSGALAAVMNVTVTEPDAWSHLTVYPAGGSVPTASNLNFLAGQTVPNLVTVKLSPSGEVDLWNNSGATHVIFDVVGWYGTASDATAARIVPLAPARVLDTREFEEPLGPGEIAEVEIAGWGGVPVYGASAVVMNVTITEPTEASHLTVFPGDEDAPNASNLNFVAGQTVPNLVIVKLSPDGTVAFRNNSGAVHVIFDVVAWVTDPELLA